MIGLVRTASVPSFRCCPQTSSAMPRVRWCLTQMHLLSSVIIILKRRLVPSSLRYNLPREAGDILEVEKEARK